MQRKWTKTKLVASWAHLKHEGKIWIKDQIDEWTWNKGKSVRGAQRALRDQGN